MFSNRFNGLLLGIVYLFFINAELAAQPNQDQVLAQQYLQKEEYVKAGQLFQKLYNKNITSQYFYESLFKCKFALHEFEELKKLVEKRLKKFPVKLTCYIDLARIEKEFGNEDNAQNLYDQAISKLTANESQIRQLANRFMQIRDYENSLKTYQEGRKLMKSDQLYLLETANLYNQLGEVDNAITSYLEFVEQRPSQVQFVKNTLQRSLDQQNYYSGMQTQLLRRIQKNSSEIVLHELLVWLYIQHKNFDAAFIQVRALDKRLKEDGKRALDLANAAMKEEEYDAAIDAYQYVAEKGKNNPYYLNAKRQLVETLRLKITKNENYNVEDINQLDLEYQGFIEEFGANAETISTIRDRALLMAYHKHDIDEAIAIMEELIELGYARRSFIAQSKLYLGDFYLVKGELWESTLLYSQVDKAMKDEPLGEEARFKNAKLSYYRGDFEWVQAQLNILKGATSELIANDAINLAVFIQDNTGLDSTLHAMMLFADADLLIFQNKNDEALMAFDDLLSIYPGHALTDDVLFAKSKIYLSKRDFEQAAKLLQQILDQYFDDILADNAAFKLAQLNENIFEHPAKAMELYQSIIIDHKGSIFVAEARKRFRKLRGDLIN